jgi:hypothetical protein
MHHPAPPRIAAPLTAVHGVAPHLNASIGLFNMMKFLCALLRSAPLLNSPLLYAAQRPAPQLDDCFIQIE